MKKLLHPRALLPVGLILSLAGAALRGGLYRSGMDEKQLLISAHPLSVALWAVTALTVAWTLAACRKPAPEEPERPLLAASLPAALGHIAMAGGLALTVLLNQPLLYGTVGQLWKLTGLLSAPLLLWAGFCRAQGKTPNVLSHAMPCIFFALHLVCHYQVWCSDPQLQNYFFAFTGCIGLMLLCYQLAATDTGSGREKGLLTTGLLALYLCTVCVANTEYLYLYAGGVLLAAGSLWLPEPQRD